MVETTRRPPVMRNGFIIQILLVNLSLFLLSMPRARACLYASLRQDLRRHAPKHPA